MHLSAGVGVKETDVYTRMNHVPPQACTLS